jgi:hypothetical protein
VDLGAEDVARGHIGLVDPTRERECNHNAGKGATENWAGSLGHHGGMRGGRNEACMRDLQLEYGSSRRKDLSTCYVARLDPAP